MYILVPVSQIVRQRTRHRSGIVDALQAAGLTLIKPSNVQFDQKETQYLGHVISATGISVSTDRIQAITQLPPPIHASNTFGQPWAWSILCGVSLKTMLMSLSHY